MSSSPRDDNRVPGLVARSNVDHAALVVLEADPTTHALVVSATLSGGGTSSTFGAAIPATGTAAGFSDGTNMQLGRVFDGDTGAGTQYVLGTILRISGNGGSIEAKGQQAMASSIPVAIASDQASFPVTIAAGSAVIGHVIVDSGTITTVSAVTAITNALPAGSNVIGHIIVDSGTITTVSAVTAITNALPAGTNVIGHVIVDSGTVTTVSTVTAVTTVSTLTNQTQEGGVNISLNAGAVDTGTRRIVQANNAGKTLASAGGSASTSGNNTLVVAGTNKLKVYAFSLTTTVTTAMTCIFQSGASGTELWRVILQAPTSVNVGANLAVTPPAYIFATASATLLNLNLSSANAVHWSVAYFDEA